MQATLANYRWIAGDYFSRQRTSSEETDSHRYQAASGDAQSLTQTTVDDEEHQQPQKRSSILLHVKRRESTRQSFPTKKEWEKKYPWVTCKDPSDGVFCETCLKWGNPPAGSRGAWKTRGITDCNHGTELLKQHADSQWHRDAAATAVMARQAESGKPVLELQCSSAAQQAAERKQRNRDVLRAVEISKLSCQE